MTLAEHEVLKGQASLRKPRESDLGALLLSFVKEDPKPHIWPLLVLETSPWDALAEVDPSDGIELPLFAP